MKYTKEVFKLLQNRLFSIAKLIPRGSIVADIGTDHAQIPIYLVKKNICPKVIATDINKGPLLQAKRNIKNYKLQKKIEVRQGFGLEPIMSDEVDGAIIAGMGGRSILQIIREKRDVSDLLDFLILQPMTQHAKLRYELFRLGYKITEEIIAREQNRYYEIIAAKKEKDELSTNYDMIDIIIGPVLRYKKTTNTIDYLKMRKRKLLRLIEHLLNINTIESKKAIRRYQQELELLKEVLQ